MGRKTIYLTSVFLLSLNLLLSCGKDDDDSSSNSGGTSNTSTFTQQLGSDSNEDAQGIVIDSSGNLYIAGSTGGSLDGNTGQGNNDIVLVKYNSSGTKQ